MPEASLFVLNGVLFFECARVCTFLPSTRIFCRFQPKRHSHTHKPFRPAEEFRTPARNPREMIIIIIIISVNGCWSERNEETKLRRRYVVGPLQNGDRFEGVIRRPSTRVSFRRRATSIPKAECHHQQAVIQQPAKLQHCAIEPRIIQSDVHSYVIARVAPQCAPALKDYSMCHFCDEAVWFFGTMHSVFLGYS